MLSIAERHKYILEKLAKQGFVKVYEIAQELDVTTVTVRKDLKYLEDKKLLSVLMEVPVRLILMLPI